VSLLGRWFTRSKPVPVLDPPGYRLAHSSAPPPPPLTEAPGRGPVKPSMKLMLSDGTMQEMPADPELAARAEYLIKSMLPPAPPPPPPTP
jgi:hypothetical protein